ncbi:MAG: phage major capsid protein [Clostridiales bacterium]|nr:phage major capsid protein [Clostridiales bacterium]MBQ1294189.1 phage major capsid protein [Clostridiales bacterium]
MSKQLVEKKNDLITRAEEVLNTAKTETRELTEEEAQELEQIKADIDKIKATLKLEDDFREITEGEVKPDAEPKEEEKEMNEERSMEQRALDERAAFDAYIRGVYNERNDYDMIKTANGAIIPSSIANQIIKKVYDVAPVLERSNRFNVKGNLTIPYYDESSHAITVAFQTEGTAPDASQGDFTSISLGGFLAGALCKIGKDLIANAQFDVVQFVVNEMGESIARFIEKELLNPSDTTNKVKGMSTLTNGVTAAATNVITTDELVKVRDKVKDVYQQNAIWVMSPATRTALRLLKDNAGHYLLNDDISSPFGTTLMGKPVYVSENMEDIAANKIVVYYGDFKGLATKFAGQIDVQVLRERFADQFCIGVVGTFDFDAKVCDQQKLAKLTMAAS